MQIHVRLFNAHKSVYGRSVECASVIQRLFQLVGSDSNIFQMTEHICKLQADKFNILFLHQPHNVVPCIFLHNNPVPAFPGVLKTYLSYS